MKHRWGGLLSLVLGLVLIVNGALTGGGAGSAGTPQPTCRPGPGIVNTCPTGAITITEHTAPTTSSARSAAAPTAPAAWRVTVTSADGQCTRPNATAVNEVLMVPNDGSASTQQLFVFADPAHAMPKCRYVLAVQPVGGFTPSLDPTSPVTLPYDSNLISNNDLPVTLTEAFAAPAPSTSASASKSASASASASSRPASPSASTEPLAESGPRTKISVSLVTGIALCLLGLVLLLAGRTAGPLRRTGRRR